jgi:hypothetical protein
MVKRKVKAQKSQKQSQKSQKQSQSIVVNVGGRKGRRAATSTAPSPFPSRFPANFPPGFNPSNPNLWLTPPPPIPQRERVAFAEGGTADALGVGVTAPIPFTFVGAENVVKAATKEVALTDPVGGPLFDAPPVIEFTQPEPDPEEAAERGAALVASSGTSVPEEKEELPVGALRSGASLPTGFGLPAESFDPFGGGGGVSVDTRVSREIFKLPTDPQIAFARPVAEADLFGSGGSEGSVGSGLTDVTVHRKKKEKDYVEGPVFEKKKRSPEFQYDGSGHIKLDKFTGQPIANPKFASAQISELSAAFDPFSAAVATELPPLKKAGALGPLFPNPSTGYQPLTFLGQPAAAAEKKERGLERGRGLESSRGRSSSVGPSSAPFFGSSGMGSGISPAEASFFA